MGFGFDGPSPTLLKVLNQREPLINGNGGRYEVRIAVDKRNIGRAGQLSDKYLGLHRVHYVSKMGETHLIDYVRPDVLSYKFAVPIVKALINDTASHLLSIASVEVNGSNQELITFDMQHNFLTNLEPKTASEKRELTGFLAMQILCATKTELEAGIKLPAPSNDQLEEPFPFEAPIAYQLMGRPFKH